MDGARTEKVPSLMPILSASIVGGGGECWAETTAVYLGSGQLICLFGFEQEEAVLKGTQSQSLLGEQVNEDQEIPNTVTQSESTP